MLYKLKRVQYISAGMDQVWDFISDPMNLAKITPDDMRFEVLDESEMKPMYAGQIIEYFVRPVPWMRTYWVTEITHVREHEFFVDEQRFGPYAFWHHKHLVRAVDGGIEMTDIVHYKVPFGWLGRCVHYLWIRKKLEGIFDYRNSKIEALFSNGKSELYT